MYIVINGGGRVGSFLAHTMKKKGHSVAIIEKNGEVCQKLAAKIDDILVINGDGCDVSAQEDAGVSHANVFASVTGEDDDNLIACELVKATFSATRTVARVNNPKNEGIFHKMGIEAISSTTIISRLIEEETTIDDVITLHTMKKGQVSLIEVELPREGCAVCNKNIAKLKLPDDCVIVSVIRKDKVIIPKGNTVLEAGDSVIAITNINKEDKLKKILTRQS